MHGVGLIVVALLLGQVPAPSQEISGPDRFLRDTFGTFSVKGMDAKTILVWDVFPFDWVDTVECSNEGTLKLVAPPGRYVIQARLIDPATKARTILRKAVTIDDRNGPTPPTPTPTPPGPVPPIPTPPTPPAPDEGFLGLKSKAKAWAESTPAVPTRAAEAQRLAAVYDEVAKLIEDKKLSAALLIISALRERSNKALGSAEVVNRWKPFSDGFAKEAKALLASGQLSMNEPQQWAKGLRSIALGLKDVK